MTFENGAFKAVFHFTNSFLIRNIVIPPPLPMQIYMAGTEDPPPPPPRQALIFFLILPFSKVWTEGVPQQKRGADTVKILWLTKVI